MKMQSVASSNVDAIGFENNTLFVRFKGGGVYKYLGVGESTYRNMLEAESAGKFLNKVIKPTYEFEKVEEVISPEEFLEKVINILQKNRDGDTEVVHEIACYEVWNLIYEVLESLGYEKGIKYFKDSI